MRHILPSLLLVHAEMCENRGYEKLSEYIKKQSIGEMKHAEALVQRILFLDGSPAMKPLERTIGKKRAGDDAE